MTLSSFHHKTIRILPKYNVYIKFVMMFVNLRKKESPVVGAKMYGNVDAIFNLIISNTCFFM